MEPNEDPPRVRQCVSFLFFFLFVFFVFFAQSAMSVTSCSREGKELSRSLFIFFSSDARVSRSLSLSLSHQMAPSIWTSEVFRNLAKVDERTVLGVEVAPGLCQARNI